MDHPVKLATAIRSEPVGIRFLKKYFSGGERNIKVYQTSVLLITFIAYACFHASRKPISIVKGVLKGNWPPFKGKNAASRLGELDLSFLLVYSFGMYFAGHLGDRLDLRIFLMCGMVGSGAFVALFGLGYWLEIHNLGFYLVVQMIQGLFQATGWPSVVAIVGNWFGKNRRGFILGIWNAHTSFGNIAGSLISASVLVYGWGWSFVLPGILVAGAGVFVFLFLVVSPEDAGFEPLDAEINEITGTEDEKLSAKVPVKKVVELPKLGFHSSDVEESNRSSGIRCSEEMTEIKLHGEEFSDSINSHDASAPDLSADGENEKERLLNSEENVSSQDQTSLAIGFVEAWMIPGVAPYALCLFFSKLVAYTFLYWLPFYIKHTAISGKHLSDTSAGNLSTLFDVGGVLGGILAGYISDKLEAQAITSVSFLYSAIPVLILFRLYGSISISVNVALMMAGGLFVNGPYSLITTAVSADLGTHRSTRGNSRALATVTAIIDGTGSVGAALGPLLTGYISERGWNGVFVMLILSIFLAGLFLIRLARAEFAEKYSRSRASTSET